jgi:hypothetical protein
VTARWYVLSRGIRRLDDYTWLPVNGGDQRELERIREHLWHGMTLDELVDDERQGLVLAHDPKLGTIVYVTGLAPGSPCEDALGRPIRAAMIGVAAEPSARTELVAVAVAALNGTLATLPPLSFELDVPPGFDFDEDTWAAIVAGQVDDTEEIRAEEAGGWTGRAELAKPKVRRDIQSQRERTATDLLMLTSDDDWLVPRNQIIVLRTLLVDRKLRPSQPWRMLIEISDDSPADHRFDIDPFRILEEGFRHARKVPSWVSRKIGLTLLGAVVIVAVVIVWSVRRPGPTPPAPEGTHTHQTSTVPVGPASPSTAVTITTTRR